MLARLSADRLLRRLLPMLALLVFVASPASAQSFGARVRARSGAFARRFTLGRTAFSRSRSVARKAERRGPVRPLGARRRRTGAEHARHISSDRHTGKPGHPTQATSPNAGVQNSPRVQIADGPRTFVVMSSDPLPASDRTGSTPSRAPPASFSD